MSDEPKLDAEEWARWALLGDPYAPVPITLKELVDRMTQALRKFALSTWEQSKRNKK